MDSKFAIHQNLPICIIRKEFVGWAVNCPPYLLFLSFIVAGSQAVVSSLWTVSDLSTAFLMMKFYEHLQTINNVSVALNQEQQWLRNLTTEEFESLLVKYHQQIYEGL